MRWLLALYQDARNRAPDLPPRELLNAGLPLLLRSSVPPAAVMWFSFAFSCLGFLLKCLIRLLPQGAS